MSEQEEGGYSEPVLLPGQRAQWEEVRGPGRNGDKLGSVRGQIGMGCGCSMARWGASWNRKPKAGGAE